ARRMAGSRKRRAKKKVKRKRARRSYCKAAIRLVGASFSMAHLPSSAGDQSFLPALMACLHAVLLLISCYTSACRGLLSNRAVSNPTFRLRGGHETGCSPGTAPPELPSQPTTDNIVHPDFGELCLVSPSGPNIGDHQPTARTQHPHRFVDCFLPASTSP